MGASVSTNKSDVMNRIVNTAYNSCASNYRNTNGVSASNEVDLQGVKHYPPVWCKDSCTSHPITGAPVCGANFEVNQAAKVDADCVIDQMQTSINDVMSQLSAESKAGILGVAVSSNISNVKNEIENIVENSCESVAADNQQTYKDIEVRACNFYAIQNLDAKKSCKIGSSQGIANTVATTMTAKSEGVNFLDLFGGLLIWLLIPAALIGILIIYKVIKSMANNNRSTMENPYMYLNNVSTDTLGTASSRIGLPTNAINSYKGSTIDIASAPAIEKCKNSGQSMVGALTQMLVKKDKIDLNVANGVATGYVTQNLDKLCNNNPNIWTQPDPLYAIYKAEQMQIGGGSRSINMLLIILVALFIFFLIYSKSNKSEKKVVLEKPSVYSKKKKY